VSQQLARLEQEAGVPLLERWPSRVRLTEAGRVLVAHTEEILARLHEAEAEMRATALSQGGELRVASFPSAAATVVPPALTEFAARNPGVSVTLVESDPVSGAVGVKSGDYDVALAWEYDYVPVSAARTVTRVAVLDDPIHVLLPPEHPAAAAPVVDLAALADTPWITSTPQSSCNPFTARACQAAGFEPRVVAETNDHRVLQRLVAEGVGAALESELSLRELRTDVAVRPLASPLKRRIFAVHRRDAGPAAVAFVDVLCEIAKPRLKVVAEPVQAA
jgi:DNA-binding transcriptional LysR family regulator